MYTVVFYGVAGLALVASFFSDRERTVLALRKAAAAFRRILPEFLTVITVTGMVLAVLSPSVIAALIGAESGGVGVLISSLAGSITLMPGFVAFPMAAMLLEKGAGILQIAAFVSALMMVGVLTFPMEQRTIGTRAALARNLLSWVASLMVAALLALVLRLLP